MPGDFDFSELNKLAVDLGKVGPHVVPRARVILEKSSADIERDGKVFCPVDTGNLRNSISRDLKGLEAEIGPTASYGSYVEFGTSRKGPAAYMGPALDRHSGEFEQALGMITDDLL